MTSTATTPRGGGGGAGSTNNSQTYRGTGPFSEPEPRNVAGLLRERQPIAVNSNHTYTGLVLRPWGFSGGQARYSPDEDLMRDLGSKMCDANGYRNIHSFDLYVTTGTTTDWTYVALGSLSYTFEIGFSNFHPDYAGDDGPLHHYGLNREGFILLGETARFQNVSYQGVPQVDKSDPARHQALESVHDVSYGTHAVIAGRVVEAGGGPASAELVVERTTEIPLGAGDDNAPFAEVSRATSRSAADGTFAWHLPPSTTPIAKERGETEAWTFTVTVTVTVTAADGRSLTQDVVVDRGQTAQLGTVVLR